MSDQERSLVTEATNGRSEKKHLFLLISFFFQVRPPLPFIFVSFSSDLSPSRSFRSFFFDDFLLFLSLLFLTLFLFSFSLFRHSSPPPSFHSFLSPLLLLLLLLFLHFLFRLSRFRFGSGRK